MQGLDNIGTEEWLKWMGMYLSEHTLALKRDKQRSDSSPIQAEKVKLTIISQAYGQEVTAWFRVQESKGVGTYHGQVVDLYQDQVVVKVKGATYHWAFDQIISIEEGGDQSD